MLFLIYFKIVNQCAIHVVSFMQKTISQIASYSGLSCHSGKLVSMNFLPAPENHGIVFKRTDITDKNNLIPARIDNVVQDKIGYCTIIANSEGVSVSTIEHVMAALSSHGVTNILIEVDDQELPIADGSSAPFVFMLESSHIVAQNEQSEIIFITKEVSVVDGDRSILAKPSDSLSISYELSYPEDPVLSKMDFSFNSSKMSFKYDICRARTFSTFKQAEYLKSVGMAKGGGLNNALIFKDGEVLNEEKMRYQNEPARHKVLDCIGDFYLSGHNLVGEFVCKKSGHSMNHAIIKKILSDRANFIIKKSS